MPRRDGTGPEGLGAATGRQAGFCAGDDEPGFAGAGYGYGTGLGRMRRAPRGRGSCRGRGNFAGHGRGIPRQPGAGWFDKLVELLALLRGEPRTTTPGERDRLRDFQARLDDMKQRIDEKLED